MRVRDVDCGFTAAYLSQTGLEATVTTALIKVISARPPNPLEMLWKELRPEGAMMDDDERILLRHRKEHAEGHAKHENLVACIAERDALIGQLQAKVDKQVDYLTSLAEQNAVLLDLQRRCEETEQRLEQRVRELSAMLAELNRVLACDVVTPGIAVTMPAPGVPFPKASSKPPHAPPPAHPPAHPLGASPWASPAAADNLAARGHGAPVPCLQPKIPPEVLLRLTKAMGTVFDCLTKNGAASIASTRLAAFTKALQQACNACESPPMAIAKFVRIIREVSDGKAHCSRADLLSHVPSSAGYTFDEVEALLNVLDQILGNAEALAGLHDMVDDIEVTCAFKGVMQRLFDEVLEPGHGSSKGTVPRAKVDTFAAALQLGCDASDDEEERFAMQAYVTILRSFVEGLPTVSRQRWLDCIAPEACTSEEIKRFVEILTVLVDNDEARLGLLETMNSLELRGRDEV